MPCIPDVAQAGDPQKIVFHLQLVNLEAINGFDLRRRSNALEPGRRTPPILVGHQDKPVFDRVLMDVPEPRQVGLLVSQARVSQK